MNPGLRICLGGTTAHYTGYYSGIAEEAYFALKSRKPLYLLAGFGGATKVVRDALNGKNLDRPSLSAPTLPPENADVIASVGKNLELPTAGLGPALSDLGIKRYFRQNKLTSPQNEALFEMTDIEQALDLIGSGHGRRVSE